MCGGRLSLENLSELPISCCKSWRNWRGITRALHRPSTSTLAPAVREAAEAARKSGRGTGKRRKNRSDRSIRTCGAQCVEVEVNTATGDIRVLRVAAAHDCGRIVNPLLVDPATGIAPYVFDMRIRPLLPPTVQ